MAAPKRGLSSSKRTAPFNRFVKFGNSAKNKAKQNYRKTIVFAQKKPFTSFFIALGLLLLIITLGSTIFRTQPTKIEDRSEPKAVSTYKLSDNPTISAQGEVKKSGVVTIVAQNSGIVSNINYSEGDYAKKGKSIINLSSNYQGGNAPSLQRQLAGVTYQNTKSTHDIQTELIQKQRELVNQQSENQNELREITNFSIDSTRSLVNLNREILSTVRENILTLQNSNGDPSQILQLQQVQAQIQAGNLQFETQLKNNEFQVDENNPPRKIENINKDIALKQLDIQEKAIKMSLQAAGISLQLAKVQEANMYPSSPIAGTVQKIHVKVGDSVNPGDVLATIAGESDEIIIDAKIPKEMAQKVSRIDAAAININGKVIKQVPSFVSSEATDGQLYSVIFTLDQTTHGYFTDNSFVNITLPIGQILSGTSIFIPIDSVFQTQEEAFVFVAQQNKAVSKKVELGSVTGGFVEVVNGLTLKDTIITSRTVVEGDQIKLTN